MIRIVIDTREVEKGLGEFKRQIPYATAVALTRLAQEAQGYVKSRLNEDFTIRSPWVAGRVKYKPANKRRLDKGSQVGSSEERLRDQALGAVLTGKDVGKVARTGKGLARPRKASKTPPSRHAKALYEKGLKASGAKPIKRKKGRHSRRRLPFYIPVQGGRHALVRRKGNTRLPVETIYAVPRSIKIPARWPLGTHVRRSVAANYYKQFALAMAHAVETARTKTRAIGR